MNDDTMRGIFRATDETRAYEATISPEFLCDWLWTEARSAEFVAEQATDQKVRDEWQGRAAAFRAAYRRHEEAQHVA